MIKLNLKKFFIQFFILLIIFSFDRITKIYILNIAEENGNVEIYVNSFLNLFLVWNTGIGFGLFSFQESEVYNFITLIIVIINLIIIYLIYKSKDIIGYFLLIILGGSLGNLFDRFTYSAVPDFIDFNFKGYHWFIFNVADIFITFGIICLIIAELLNYKKN